MLLTRLSRELPGATLAGAGDPDVRSLSHDSRQAGPGSLFVAVPGLKADGHDFIAQALQAGAAAALVQSDHEDKWRGLRSRVPLIAVPDTRVALARAAAALNGYPARRLNVIGVTGTDGKTSLSHLVAHVLPAAGEKAGLISTAECRAGEEALPDTGRFTTPEAPEVQSMLSQMVRAGCRWAVIEATSHGLALHRVDDCEYDIAAFTNVGLDHLDFHGAAGEYMAAKGRLFQMLDTSLPKDIEKTAVLNADDPAAGYFRGLTRARAVTYGIESPADVSAHSVVRHGRNWSVSFVLKAAGLEQPVTLGRPGRFNVYNALAAAAVGLAAGLEPGAIVTGLESWPGAPGRMQLVDEGQPFRVVVDFAHAPDSLRRVLGLLRETSRGRVIVVFGCIGERDKDRRFAMGRVAAESADYTIVTDDNPYTEDRDAIIGEIARGLRSAGKRVGHDFALVPDRREAVAQALAMAVDEDAVLLAGKGHEREVHLPDSIYQCNDAEVARKALRDLGHRR
jgi:UDP-N-acetylmuramoyl-L-alanyl-D-glutamate--2,6-diaminopimelate ligase